MDGEVVPAAVVKLAAATRLVVLQLLLPFVEPDRKRSNEMEEKQ